MRSRTTTRSSAVPWRAARLGRVGGGRCESIDAGLGLLVDDFASVSGMFDRSRPRRYRGFGPSGAADVARSWFGPSVETTSSPARPAHEVVHELAAPKDQRNLDFAAYGNRASQRTIETTLDYELITRASFGDRELETPFSVAARTRDHVAPLEPRPFEPNVRCGEGAAFVRVDDPSGERWIRR
jgi:hypothetical protein